MGEELKRLWDKAQIAIGDLLLSKAPVRFNLLTLPIRLTPTPTKCGVALFSGVESVEDRRSSPADNSEQ